MQLLWFRKDLRILDNKALYYASQKGPLMAVFFICPKQWEAHQVAPIQADFIERNLKQLAAQLGALGIPLLIEPVPAFTDIADRLQRLVIRYAITAIHANSEPEINEINRDKAVLAAGLPLILYQSDCIIDAGKLRSKQGRRYKVFSAFRNAWIAKVREMDLTPLPLPAPIAAASKPLQFSINYEKISSRSWPAGEANALARLKQFISEDIQDYSLQREFPALPATSQLSPYLALGVLSAKTCVYSVLQAFPDALYEKGCGAYTWINELVWREFYRHLLILKPDLCKGRNYNRLADNIVWENNVEHFQLWCRGKTGYGLVDAAMRQLNQSGWMHNRLRMVTASFLTKHLLIDWRWGEAYFMTHLIDGDLASNNGGWQWAASTGCDAQPYFRIFNPIIQSQKFDPQGVFIRNYVKELRDYDNKSIHQPLNGIVEHKQARLNALDKYSVLKKR